MLEKSGKIGEHIDKMAIVESPPSIEMPSTHEQVTTWQALGRDNSLFKPHKPLPRKRDTTISSATSPDLRAQYRSSSNGALKGQAATNGTYERTASPLKQSPTTPVLPPTPPIANNESSDFSVDESSVADTTILRSGVATPLNQQSPPTPDQTPPRLGRDLAVRPWLATQPSMASTRAESFATAREEFLSDTDSEHSIPLWIQSRSRNASHHSIPVPKVPESFRPRPSPLVDTSPRTPQAVWEDDDVWASHEAQQKFEDEDPASPSPETESYTNGAENQGIDESDQDTEEHQIMLDKSSDFDSPTLPQSDLVMPPKLEGVPDLQTPQPASGVKSSSSVRPRLPRPTVTELEPETTPVKGGTAPRRGPSLRDRLEAVDRGAPSASTEDFADQIGWSEVTTNDRSNRRKSWRLSGISTISTVDAMVFDTEPRRTKTIRRQTKTTSLRTASSPLPASNRSSTQTNPYASLDSPPRHSLSHKKARLSNQNRLSYGSDASRSLSMSSAATPSKAEVIRVAVIPERRSSLQSSQDSSRRHSTSRSLSSSGRRRFSSLYPDMHTHRLSSDCASVGSCQTCGKKTGHPPAVPPRASSLSAPTSRNNSRSNSITSDHLRIHRLQAEQDLRKTLDRMESERIAPILKAGAAETEGKRESSPPEPVDTPFSQPSVLTASGDGASIEMGEARAVNLFPHKNNSLQLIEKHRLPESRAVRSLRHTNPARDLSVLIDSPPTPRAAAADLPVMDSPLRNPREPPEPPTPTALPFVSLGRSQTQNQPIGRYGSLRRPSLTAQRYSASFIKSMTRGLSLRNARNPKSDSPQLDEKQTPMWRPRRFWDDAEYTEDESDSYSQDEGEVRNTLGMPQKRSVVTGPMSLMRSLSEGRNSRRQTQQRSRTIYQQRSYGSLSRLRAAKKLYKVPGFRGVHFQFVGLNAWQERMRLARSRKEDEKREARRRILRDAIGPNVISRGDSRFPETGLQEGTGREVIH